MERRKEGKKQNKKKKQEKIHRDIISQHTTPPMFWIMRNSGLRQRIKGCSLRCMIRTEHSRAKTIKKRINTLVIQILKIRVSNILGYITVKTKPTLCPIAQREIMLSFSVSLWLLSFDRKDLMIRFGKKSNLPPRTS